MQQIPAACYDLSAVSRFLRSVAQATAMQQYTSLAWQPYLDDPTVPDSDKRVLRVIYTVLAWKEPPGTLEVVQDTAKIELRTNELHERYLLAWIDHLTRDPARAARYLEDMQKSRDNSTQFIREMFADAADLQREMLDETDAHLRGLGGIKLASTLVVTGMGLALTSLGAVLVGTGYSVGRSLAKTQSQAAGAKVVGVSIEIAKSAAEQGLERGAGKAGNSLLAEATGNAAIMGKAQRKVQDAANRLAKEGLSRTSRRTANRNLQAAQAQLANAATRAAHGTMLASGAHFVKSATPVVFAASSVIEELSEFSALWEETR
jgi:hypothetical protein